MGRDGKEFEVPRHMCEWGDREREDTETVKEYRNLKPIDVGKEKYYASWEFIPAEESVLYEIYGNTWLKHIIYHSDSGNSYCNSRYIKLEDDSEIEV